MEEDHFYVRDPRVVVLLRESRCFIIPPDGPPVTIAEVDAEAISSLLERTVQPIENSELAQSANAETLSLLVDLGLLWRGGREELLRRLPVRESANERPCGRIVVGVSGAISAAGILEQVIAISRNFASQVDVILTAGALQFVRPNVFENWGIRTWTDPFALQHGQRVPHIHLARADLVLIAPASASTIQRLASGACSDLLSLVVVATASPVVVAPVMNSRMWRNPAVARNVAQLRRDGIWVIEPGLGFALSDDASSGDIGGFGFQFHAPGLIRALRCALQASTQE